MCLATQLSGGPGSFRAHLQGAPGRPSSTLTSMGWAAHRGPVPRCEWRYPSPGSHCLLGAQKGHLLTCPPAPGQGPISRRSVGSHAQEPTAGGQGLSPTSPAPAARTHLGLISTRKPWKPFLPVLIPPSVVLQVGLLNGIRSYNRAPTSQGNHLSRAGDPSESLFAITLWSLKKTLLKDPELQSGCEAEGGELSGGMHPGGGSLSQAGLTSGPSCRDPSGSCPWG